jgi:hypothetical protein
LRVIRQPGTEQPNLRIVRHSINVCASRNFFSSQLVFLASGRLVTMLFVSDNLRLAVCLPVTFLEGFSRQCAKWF